MFLHRAMRYYRLWIYSCNLALLFSVMVFIALSAWIFSDFHMTLFPSITLRQPTVVYAYFALAIQGGILQAIGCVGALRMNERMLNIYWTLMLILLFGDILVGIVWIFRFSYLTGSLRGDLKSRLHADYGVDAQFQLIWDRIQMESRCCGISGPQDFNTTAWMILQRHEFPQHRQVVPRSCCRMHFDAAFQEEVPINHTCVESYHEEFIHHKGCYDAVHRWLQHAADMLSVLGFCVIAFLKLCFLGILRYEIREMIQKIKILKCMDEQSPLMNLEANIPRQLLTGDSVCSSDVQVGNHVSSDGLKSPNGNNNETDGNELKKSSPV